MRRCRRGRRAGRSHSSRALSENASPRTSSEAGGSFVSDRPIVQSSWLRTSPPGNCVVCTFTYALPARIAARSPATPWTASALITRRRRAHLRRVCRSCDRRSGSRAERPDRARRSRATGWVLNAWTSSMSLLAMWQYGRRSVASGSPAATDRRRRACPIPLFRDARAPTYISRGRGLLSGHAGGPLMGGFGAAGADSTR